MALRVLLVDDEPFIREWLRDVLDHEPGIDVIDECTNGREALQAIRSEQPDLVFLDVEMPEMDGLAMLGALRPDETPYIIFTTAYDRYALQAFEAGAVDYLLKPFNDERLRHAVQRARTRLHDQEVEDLNQKLGDLLAHLSKTARPPAPKKTDPDENDEKSFGQRIPIKDEGRITFVNIGDVDWIEAADNYVILHVGTRSHMVHESMQNMAARLDDKQFLRIHRSRIVNLQRIKALHPLRYGEYQLVLHNGTCLTSSRGRSKKLLEILGVKGT